MKILLNEEELRKEWPEWLVRFPQYTPDDR